MRCRLQKTRIFTSRAYYWVLAATAIIPILYLYGEWDPDFLYVLSNGLPPVLALPPVIFAFMALLKLGKTRDERALLIWLGYASGISFWFLGEFTWAVYSILLGVPIPYPSIADAFWLVGYPCFLIALSLQSWPFRAALSPRQIAAGLVSVSVLTIGVLVILVPPIVFGAEELLTKAVSLAYPLLDVLLLVVAVPVFTLFKEGTLWRPSLFVMVGIILTLIADTLFSWTTLQGIYYNGHPLELFYHWSYLAFTLGFYLKLKETRI